MSDIFKNEVLVGNYILYPINTRMNVGKVIKILNDKIVEVATSYSTYNHREIETSNAIIIDENQVTMLSDSINYIELIENNIKAVAAYTLEQSLKKQQEISRQKELAKTCIPGHIYKGKNYRNIFMYLGQNDSKQHVYCDIQQSSQYDSSTRTYSYIYTFIPYASKFMYTSKAKKLPTEKVDTSLYDVNSMIIRLRSNLTERSRIYGRQDTDWITVENINDLEELYNKVKI